MSYITLEWCAEHRKPHNKRITIRVPEEDQILTRMQRIPLRKGELVIWNGSLIHCNFPNHSNEMRLIQFIRMLPDEVICIHKDRYSATRVLHQYPEQRYALSSGELPLSDSALRLLGLQNVNPKK